MDLHDRVQALKHLQSAAELLKCGDLAKKAEELRKTVTTLDIYYYNGQYDFFITQWKNEYVAAEGDLTERNALLQDLIMYYSDAEILPELQVWMQERYC